MSSQSVREVQDKILETMKYIDSLCRKHGIVYYIMGGTALGAVRHGGFIPWDDDLDIFMTPCEYEKFKAVFEKGNVVLKDGVLFDCGTVVDFNQADQIRETGINLSNVDGYAGEVNYFIDCVKSGEVCAMATPESTASTIALIERTLKALTRV